MDSRCSSSADSRLNGRGVGSLNARLESYEAGEKTCISAVRRTFCLFVTFDLLFISLLWIIELNVNGGIAKQLNIEVLHYDYHASFFDIYLLAVFRFASLILAYAVCRLNHWWAIAVTTAVCTAFLIIKVILSKLLSQGAFGYLLPISSFILAWLQTWLLDFKVLPQEAQDRLLWFGPVFFDHLGSAEKHSPGFLSIMDAVDRAPLLPSEGQFYSPPESLADSDEELAAKVDPEKELV